MTFGYAGNTWLNAYTWDLWDLWEKWAESKICKLAEEDYGVDTLKITDDDAAFILGKGGKTKVPVG